MLTATARPPTANELAEIQRFYASPTGKKLLELEPKAVADIEGRIDAVLDAERFVRCQRDIKSRLYFCAIFRMHDREQLLVGRFVEMNVRHGAAARSRHCVD